MRSLRPLQSQNSSVSGTTFQTFKATAFPEPVTKKKKFSPQKIAPTSATKFETPSKIIFAFVAVVG
jgi:hypothetical protein